MLVVHTWTNAPLKELILSGGSAAYGHAAMTLPPPEEGKRSVYISWWPSHENRTDEFSKLGNKMNHSERVEGRSFLNDAWAESSGRYTVKQIGTVPALGLLEPLDRFEPTEALIKAFAGVGVTLSPDHVIIGALDPGQHWLVYEAQQNALYHLFLGRDGERLKVLANEGFRHLFDCSVAESLGPALAAIVGLEHELKRDVGDDGSIDYTYVHATPAELKAQLEAFKYPIGQYQSATQFLNAGPSKKGTFSMLMISCHQAKTSALKGPPKTPSADYLVVVYRPPQSNKKVVRFFWMTRQHLVPDHNVAIPVLSEERFGLDDRAIHLWWTLNNRASKPQWHVYERNCSVIVLNALRVGGAERWVKPERPWFGLWKPEDVRLYAEKVRDAVGQGPLTRARRGAVVGQAPSLGPELTADYLATHTSIWTADEFRRRSNLGSFSVRPTTVMAIDRELEKYAALVPDEQAFKAANFKKQRLLFSARATALGRVLDRLYEHFLEHPGSKRNAAISDLGNLVESERTVMTREACRKPEPNRAQPPPASP